MTDLRARWVSRHAHTRMIFEDESCRCEGCGQEWYLTDRGWEPVPPTKGAT